MSIIIAAKIKDRVVMICDSAESAGDTVSLLTAPERFKVLKLGDVLVGSAGRVKNIRRLVEHPEWFQTNGAPFDKKFIVKNIIPRWFEDLEKHQMICEDDDFPGNEATVILAHKDKLFSIERTFAVREIDKFASVGYTKSLIHPFLLDMKEGEEFEIMLQMMRLSSDLASSVRPPYHYIDTVDFEYKTIEV